MAKGKKRRRKAEKKRIPKGFRGFVQRVNAAREIEKKTEGESMGFFGTLARGALGFVAGGPVGAATALVAGSGGDRERKAQVARNRQASRGTFAGVRPTRGFAPQEPGCRPGTVKVGRFCVDASAALPGGDPLFTSASEFQVTSGAFGMPATIPKEEVSTRLECPRGMVLGEDDLCYPKQVLRRDSRFRKWRPGARPILTGGQRRAISKARTSVTTARDAIAGLGVTVKKK